MAIDQKRHFRQAILMWSLLAFFSFLQFFIQASGNIMGGAWQQDFHLNDFDLSLLSSSFFYAYMIVQVFAGFLYSHWGAQRVVRIALIIFLMGLFLFVLTYSFEVAILARFLMGAGSGFAFIGMVFVAASWFSGSQFITFVGLGELLSMFLTSSGQWFASPFIQTFGWRSVLMGFGIVGVIFLLLVVCFLKNPADFQPNTKPFLKTLGQQFKQILCVKQVWLAGIFCSAAFGLITVVAALWGSLFLKRTYGFSYIEATSLIAIIPFGVAVGASTFGFVNERYISTVTLIRYGAIILMLVYLFSLFWKHSGVFSFVLYGAFGFFGGVNILSYYLAERSVEKELRGIAIGFCNAIVILLGALCQSAIGFCMEKLPQIIANPAVAYRLAMLPFVLILVLGLIAAFLIKRKPLI